MRNISVLWFGASYIRDFTVSHNFFESSHDANSVIIDSTAQYCHDNQWFQQWQPKWFYGNSQVLWQLPGFMATPRFYGNSQVPVNESAENDKGISEKFYLQEIWWPQKLHFWYLP